ncbi:MEDS domain-containing protein [Streptomyces sp. NPDC005481]|uniref:MEDS domain-containing protein n=1 Tax=Streptomyces sp. NPDC005481 TaxID=3154881 RepID=UPI0033B10FCC
MSEHEEHTRHPGTIPVQQMRPGDHAFFGYEGDTHGRDVMSAFVWAGLARGEKVIVFGPPHLAESQVWSAFEEAPGPLLATARRTGRLSLSSMRQLIMPEAKFTADRQWERITEETRSARDEGFTGLRTYIDMGWVADLGADVEAMMDRERRAGHLFADGFYSEICAYDEDRFEEPVLRTMRHAHPRDLLTRIGQLRCLHAGRTLHVVGEADLTTRADFVRALRDTLDRAVGDVPVTMDLRRVEFLSVRCARDLVRLLDGDSGHRVRIRCSARHATLLSRLGARPADIEVSG